MSIHDIPTPTWFPSPEQIQKTNIAHALRELNLPDYENLYRWSCENRQDFWAYIIKKLAIQFHTPYQKIVDLSQGVTQPKWLPGARYNIVTSCFNADANAPAIICYTANQQWQHLSYQELAQLVNQIANGLVQQGWQVGDRIAIDMPMNSLAVASYLAIIKAGMTAVSIADSFAVDEIKVRLDISHTKACITQDYVLRGNKALPLYEKVAQASSVPAIVIPLQKPCSVTLRAQDLLWQDFLSNNTHFEPINMSAEDESNILFSSGTTGAPKAIPWTHCTPIKVGSDSFFHHNIQKNEHICWPTNLGWMMGPWLIYATLLNQACICLYENAPLGSDFGEFVQDAKVNMLGVIPSLVSTWRETQCMEKLDWSAIKRFSSTGECSNTNDMQYLMNLAGNKPVIEYCGGTEVVGYLTGSMVQPAAPAAFSTKALGLDFVLFNDVGEITDTGEVGLIPPSIGFSNTLLNRDHDEVYYQDMPNIAGQILRRHGDQVRLYSNGYYRALGRVDDTMNLGGIKTSSAEIERVIDDHPQIKECAAIAIAPKTGGPNQLLIVALTNDPKIHIDELKKQLQTLIKNQLNPLFKIADIKIVDQLPRTASQKIMRRHLRDQYQEDKL